VRRLLAIAIVAGCGDNIHVDDPALTGECIATFTGNFAESSTSPDSCAKLAPMMPASEDDVILSFTIPSTTLGGPDGLTFVLGPSPVPGHYTHSSIPSWSAIAIRTVATGGCVYSAGDSAVPSGNFTLTIDSIDASGDNSVAHGNLQLVQYVLAIMGTDCGAGNTETLDLAF
jgi:hypothetical protein